MSRLFRTLSALTLAVVVSAPATAATRTAAAPTDGVQKANPTKVYQPVLHELGAELADSLASDSARQLLLAQLQASPYVEGRLPLNRLLDQQTEIRDGLLFGNADLWPARSVGLPDLELYFPVEAHAAAWQGGDDLQIAVALPNGTSFRMYHVDGSTSVYHAKEAPAVPTLLLGRSEIDYDDPDSALVGGVHTGAMMRSEPAGRSSLDRVSAQVPTGEVGLDFVETTRGTYLTAFNIFDDHDGWFQGKLELEVFGSVNGGYSECAFYSGLDHGRYYYNSMSLTSLIARAVPTGSEFVYIRAYEDDENACSIHGDDDYLGYIYLNINNYNYFYSTSNGELGLRVGTTSSSCGDGVCNGLESTSNCCADCASCGNGRCDTACGESLNTCAIDCSCGDGICQLGENCPIDCGFDICGDGLCTGDEFLTCPFDCGGCGNDPRINRIPEEPCF